MKGKRKRIKRDIKEIEVIDPLEYKNNCASKNAHCIHTYDELKVELWFDKHYNIRRTLGDDNGKRDGIDVEVVQNLIIEGFRYLLDIYLRGIQFSFINYFDPINPDKKTHRIVLKRAINETFLNIVSEIHYLDTSKFEITIITAMVVNDFHISDGQYAIIIGKETISLTRKIQGKMNTIFKLNR